MPGLERPRENPRMALTNIPAAAGVAALLSLPATMSDLAQSMSLVCPVAFSTCLKMLTR